jgi:hypothetical protein
MIRFWLRADVQVGLTKSAFEEEQTVRRIKHQRKRVLIGALYTNGSDRDTLVSSVLLMSEK